MNRHPDSRFRALAVAACLALLALNGCTERTTAELLADARAAAAKGDRATASIHLKRVLQKEPRNADARFLLGTLYNEVWEAKAAEAELLRAQEYGYSPVQVTIALGRALLTDRQYKRILEEIKVNDALDGESRAVVHAYRARAHLGQGQLESARPEIQKSLEAVPGNPAALVAQALTRVAERDRPGALALLDQALAKDPRHFEAWLLKGDLLRQEDKNDEAIAAYDAALKIVPTSFIARYSKVYANIIDGKLDAAQKDLPTLVKLGSGNPLVSYLQGLLHFQNKRPREAMTAVTQALKADPDHGPSLLLSGAIQSSLGAHQQAARDLERYLSLHPQSVQARKLLATVYVDMRQGKRALEIMEPALAKDTQDTALLALASRAEALDSNFTSAASLLDRAVKADPDNTRLRMELAMTRLAVGQTDVAVRELEEAVRLDAKGDAHADFLLVLALLRENRPQQALKAAQALEKQHPKNPIAHNLLGTAHYALKDTAAARKAYEAALAVKADFFPAAANLARLDFEANQKAKGRQRFLDLLEKNPKSVEAMLALASLDAQDGKSKESLDWLERAAKADPKRVEPLIEMAAYHVRSGQPKRAVEIARSAEKLRPNNPDVINVLGEALGANGDYRESAAVFTRAVGLYPKVGLFQYRLASARSLMGDFAGAQEALAKALKLTPGSEAVSIGLARATAARGNFAQAAKIAQDLQRSHPKSPAGFILEGDALALQGNYAKAVKSFEKALALNESNTEIAMRIYMGQVRAGNAAAGDAFLQKWVKDHPDDLTARALLGDAYRQLRKPQEAAVHFEIVAQKSPTNTAALTQLAWSYQEMNDPRAKEIAQRALKLAPRDPATADALGWLLVQQGDVKGGMQLIKVALSQTPNDPAARYHLAGALAKSGDRLGARQELDAVLKSGKHFPEIKAANALREQL